MSTPASRLSTFRSYSYYHVLAMCDSSATADLLSNSTDPDVWSHATPTTAAVDARPNTENLGPYSPKRIAGGGKYIVLINGATDASYVITTAKWTSATAAGAVHGDRMTSIAVEGSLQVSEPKGIAFLDQVVKCSVALGVDSSQVVYVLKTFFVGHHDQVQIGDYIDTITDIPPVTFIVYDVTGSFNEAGGSYEMQFVGASHGATRLPQYSKSVSAMSVTAGDTLEQTFRKLQDNINDNYNKYFDCVYQQIERASGAADVETLKRSLRRVKYVIEVGPDYKDGSGTKYTVTNQPQQFKNTAGCNDTAQITFPSHTSVESAISQIMMMSPQVLADMATGDTSDKVKYEYKIHSAVVSTPAADTEDGTLDYTVYYRVERFMTPKTIAFDPAFQVLAQDDEQLRSDPRYDRLRRNIIEFDYLYTGKNTDILEFDMKVNMGLAYLQTAVLSNTFKSQLERSSNVQIQPSSQDVTNLPVKFGGAVVQMPVFFGSQIKAPILTNVQNAGTAIQSAYTLTKHASLEVAEASMTIIGNDLLLGTTNLTTSPQQLVRAATRETQTTNSVPEANFQDWSYTPAYVKIRIKMPRENDDFALFTGQSLTGDPRTDPGATDYARDFWFDGYYYVYGIDHIFDNGVFTQQLHMIGIPKKSAFESSQANASKEIDMSSGVGSCFENAIKCGPTSAAPSNQPAVAVPTTPPSGTTTPTNRQDTNSAQQGARSPADVKGWDTAKPEVRAAIIDAANRYGVDPVVLAQFAKKESSFNPNAKAPTSSASGLFQFITSTWNGLVKQGKVQGLSSTDPDARFDPTYNAYAGAAYLRDNARQIGSNEVGDLYLAHFLGPGTAAKVISSDNRTGGKELLSDALGASAVAKIAKANPTIVKPNTTVGELRDWAARSMAQTLKNPVAVARQQRPPASNTPSGSVPPSPTPQSTAKTTAAQRVGAVQNCPEQESKTDAKPCGPTADQVPQDRPTRGGQ